jgi:predicted aspartyl protease
VGLFQVHVRVSNSRDPDRWFDEKFWVDTGAFLTSIPEDRLHEIGITPDRTRRVVLADGRETRYLQGQAVLSVEEIQESAVSPVLFGPPGSLFLLGALSLELFAVQADPVSQKLKPIALIQA